VPELHIDASFFYKTHLDILQDSLSCVDYSTQEWSLDAICNDFQGICGHSQAYHRIFQSILSDCGWEHVGWGCSDLVKSLPFMLPSVGSHCHWFFINLPALQH
jgi:hypothetical protein